jgi:hypothetical protein
MTTRRCLMACVETLIEFVQKKLDEANDAASSAHYGICASIDGVLEDCDCGLPAEIRRDVQAKTHILVRCQEALLAPSKMLAWFAAQTVRDLAKAYPDNPEA